jgi:polyisoprenyl-teichoic acid--peptidoglycan teichoic acid transferase
MKLSHIRPGRVFIRLASFFRRHLVLFIIAFVLVLLGFIGYRAYGFLNGLHVKPQDLLSFFGQPSQNLESTNGITNFLLLGIRGEGDDSPNATDTMIILSYNQQTKVSTMISIPRDLWVPSIQAKINSAYAYGEDASAGAGIKAAEGVILEDLGLPINYTAVINFAIFKDTIDLIGGIDIDVNPGFTDPLFPIPGMENAQPESSRYETITFATGSAHMDGDTALKFVRSRHAVGDEGTDFARSHRQQQVISALKQKMLTASFLLDKAKVDQFSTILDRNLKTNISQSLYPTLAKVALETKDNPMKSLSLSDLPDENGISILYNPPETQYKGAWVLMPKDNNWSALKKYIDNRLNGTQ